jgi:cyclohexyl-isocyanide hydratase
VFGESHPSCPEFDFKVCVAESGRICTSGGFDIAVRYGLSALKTADIIIVPSWRDIAEKPPKALLKALSAAYARGAKIVGLCLGAYVLAEAGLLDGRDATTHWAYHHLLPLVGAIPQQGRVVRDGDVFTGGGVTAGIDFALTVAAEIASPQAAQRIQLATEYDPEPPFAAGSPDRAPVEVSDELKAFYAVRAAEFKNEISAALAAA